MQQRLGNSCTGMAGCHGQYVMQNALIETVPHAVGVLPSVLNWSRFQPSEKTLPFVSNYDRHA